MEHPAVAVAIVLAFLVCHSRRESAFAFAFLVCHSEAQPSEPASSRSSLASLRTSCANTKAPGRLVPAQSACPFMTASSLHATALLTFALTFKPHPPMGHAATSMVGTRYTQQIELMLSTESGYCSNKFLFTFFLRRTIGELTRTHLRIQTDSNTLW